MRGPTSKNPLTFRSDVVILLSGNVAKTGGHEPPFPFLERLRWAQSSSQVFVLFGKIAYKKQGRGPESAWQREGMTSVMP